MNKPHPDTRRLKILVSLFEACDSDFAEYLFHARRKTKTNVAAFRRALDQWFKDGRAS